jgi:hypothetical protein
MKFALTSLVALFLAAALAGTAQADGLPVVGVDVGASGVAGPSGGGTGPSGARTVRYVTLPARGATLVARIRGEGGQVLDSRLLLGKFTVPAVAYDATADGLSADGRTLVLISPRAKFPRARTTLAILDAPRLRVRQVVTLSGDFSFDAISPTGATMYLVEYLSARDATLYAVRAYDLRRHRLLPEPVVDPTEPDEKMGGYPVTRAWSPDGRWAYTLYDRPGEAPFIHALDTSGRTARCIDLDELAGNGDLYRLKLDGDAVGGRLAVMDGEDPLVLVDTRTFVVSAPAEPKSTAPTAPHRDGGGFPWPLVAAPGLGVLLAAAGAAFALRRRPSAAPRET